MNDTAMRCGVVLVWLSVAATAAAELPRPVGQWRPRDPNEKHYKRAVVDAPPNFDISRAGAISMWCRSDEPVGALFSWGREEESGSRNLAVVFDTRLDWGEPGREVRLWAGGKRRYTTYSTELPDMAVDRWTHVVVSIDGPTMTFHYDGQPVMEVVLPFVLDLTGQSLRVGRYQWSGEDVFCGSIDKVAIYDRALTRGQVLELYRQQCKLFDHDATLFARPDVEVAVQSEAGRLAVRARCGRMGDLPAGAKVRASIGDRVITVFADPNGRPMLLLLDVAELPPGDVTVEVSVHDAAGKRIGEATRTDVSWPGRDEAFRGVRVLNNLVWELINEKPGGVAGQLKFAFTQPKRRWIYIHCTGQHIDITVDGETVTLPEQMLYLPTGEHTLAIQPSDESARVDSLIVRSIPQLIFDSMIPIPHVESAIPYNEDFIRRHIVPHVNTFTVIESNRKPRPQQPLFKEIFRSGRRILGHCLVPREVDGKPITGEAAAEFISKTWGMTRADMHGVVADEFGISREHCAAYADAVRRLEPGRDYFPYVGRLYTGEAGRKLVQALVDTGSAFLMKRYLRCPSTEQSARDAAWRAFVPEAGRYRTLCPGSIESMIVCFGYMCTPNEFLNVVPQANYKTFLDMQFHLVANEPEFWATRGLTNYYVHYADEETTRWLVHLYRHYGIEGHMQPAAADPFNDSRLMTNGDFADGTEHWKVSSAAPDSIRIVDEIHFGWLQGRYPYTPRGDSALVMVRSKDKPNRVSQTIRHLQPGRRYAFRMISAEYGDFTRKERHALRVTIDGADVQPDQSYTHIFHNSYAHSYGKYGSDQDAWMNYHWILFRAKAATAELSVTDWASDGEPGGRVGQPLMFNYVQVHPYFEN